MNDIDPNAPEILFINGLETMLKSVGITKMYEAMDYFKLMKESVYREVFNKQNPNNTEKYKEHRGRQAFIKIFMFRYKQTYDIDYTIPITDRDAHLINLLLKSLEEAKIPIDPYLEWYFEDYIVTKKSKVESIIYPCQKWVLQSFKLHNKDLMVDFQQKQLDETERIALFDKAKEIIRDSKIIGKQNIGEDVVTVLKKYNNGEILLDELRTLIGQYKEELKSQKDKLGK